MLSAPRLRSGSLRSVAIARSLAPLLLGLAVAVLLLYLAQTDRPSVLKVLAWVGIGSSDRAFYAKVLMDIGINIVLAVSLNIVNGFTGQFSIGHAGFMAVGGYAAGAITYYGSFRLWGDASVHGGWLSGISDGGVIAGGDLLFVSACLAGGLVAAAAGYIVGLPSLRLRGDYLAIVTLGFGEIVRVLLQQTSPDVPFRADEIRQMPIRDLATRLGGSLGFTGIPFYTTLFWVYLFVAVTLLVAYRLKESSHGRAFLSIREDEIAAEAMGIPLTRFKVRAFVLAAFFAGIAGGLFAHEIGTTLNPRELGFMKSFDIIIMVVLGGMGSISGAALAAALLTILPEALRSPPHVWPYGLAAVAIILLVRRRAGLRAELMVLIATVALELVRMIALWRGVNLAEYRMVIYALSLIVMMIVRPRGLFGLREIWDFRFLVRRRRGAALPSDR